jgi:hypothetical protein
MRPDNPVRGVERYADRQHQRRLTEDEYAALGTALRKATDDGLAAGNRADAFSPADRLAPRGSYRIAALRA